MSYLVTLLAKKSLFSSFSACSQKSPDSENMVVQSIKLSWRFGLFVFGFNISATAKVRDGTSKPKDRRFKTPRIKHLTPGLQSKTLNDVIEATAFWECMVTQSSGLEWKVGS